MPATKKEHETECLEATLRKVKVLGGQAWRVARKLAGDPAERDRDEEPDFLMALLNHF